VCRDRAFAGDARLSGWFFWAGGGANLPGGNGFAVEEKEKGGFFKEEKTACT
jgi:hypothetical protein